MDTSGTPTGQRCSPFGLRRRGAKHPGRARTTPRRERQPSLSRSPHASAAQTLPRSRSSLKALLCAGVNLGSRAPKDGSLSQKTSGWLVLSGPRLQRPPTGEAGLDRGAAPTAALPVSLSPRPGGCPGREPSNHLWGCLPAQSHPCVGLSSQSGHGHTLLSASGRARYLFPRSGGLHLNFNPLVLDKRFFYSKYFIVAH